MLTTITTVMAFIMIYILWWMIYGLFTAKSKMQVVSIAGLIALLFTPTIFKTSYNLYAS